MSAGGEEEVVACGIAAAWATPSPDAPFPGADEQARRLAAFCDAYGEPGIEPGDVLRSAVAKLHELVEFIEREAAAGDRAQQAVLARGDVEIYERDIAYLERAGARIA
jgi:hypothetical protein